MKINNIISFLSKRNFKSYINTKSTVLYFLMFISCVARPQWISDPATSDLYWYGTGIVSRPFEGESIRNKAIQNAMNEIASQIKINISSELIDIVIQNDQTESTYAESLIKTRVDENLSNIEIIDSYEDKERYYIHARLSKKTYYDTIKRKRANATDTAVDMYKKAVASLSANSLLLLNSAIEEIMPFIDSPIYVDMFGNRSNLYSLIKVATTDIFDRISIVPASDSYTVRLGFKNNQTIGVFCIDKNTGRPVPGLQLDIALDTSDSYSSAVSGTDGGIEFSLPKTITKDKIQYLNIYLSKDIFGKRIAKTQIPISIDYPHFSMSISESKDNINFDSSYILPIIKRSLSDKLNARFMDRDKSDFNINVEITSRSKGTKPNEWDIYTSYTTFELSIVNSVSGSQLYSTVIENVKGSSFISFDDSGRKAMKKISDSVEGEILSQVIEAFQGF